MIKNLLTEIKLNPNAVMQFGNPNLILNNDRDYSSMPMMLGLKLTDVSKRGQGPLY